MDTLPQLRSHADLASASGGSESAVFGEFLRRARERRGLTLQQISHETKIPERHLKALEHGNLSAVPRGIYRRAEVRAYAKTVGLDQNLALAEFERVAESRNGAGVPAAQLMEEEPPPRALAMIGILTLAIAAISITAMWTEKFFSPDSDRAVLAATFVTPTKPLELARAPGQMPGTVATASRPAPVNPEPLPASTARAPALPVAPATPPAKRTSVNAQLVITTEPNGARVTIDGVGWGMTPLTIAHLPFGDKQIRVTKDGFESATRLVSLGNGRSRRTLHIRLRVRQ